MVGVQEEELNTWILRIEWTPTAENESDIFTKNVDNQTFKKHVKNICEEEE